MTIHLIKLSVGSESLAELTDWQEGRLRALRAAGKAAELIHVTRQTPRRAEALLGGGSIYWVIKGFVAARQPLLELRPMEKDGVPHCGLVYAPGPIRVEPRPCRAFQGWRYLQPADAPRDLPGIGSDEDVPEEMLRELAVLGLL